jgi:hypothetical protein
MCSAPARSGRHADGATAATGLSLSYDTLALYDHPLCRETGIYSSSSAAHPVPCRPGNSCAGEERSVRVVINAMDVISLLAVNRSPSSASARAGAVRLAKLARQSSMTDRASVGVYSLSSKAGCKADVGLGLGA